MINEWIVASVETIRNLGWIGPAVFILLYVVLTAALIPGSILTLVAGFMYGPVYGVALVSPTSVLAATTAFFLGRTALRDRIERKLESYPFLRNLNEAVERSGFKLVMLLRLSPAFPFVFLNYALSLTRIRLRDYILASAIGMFPATVLYVYLGSLAFNVSQLLSGQREETVAASVLYWLGLVATGIVTFLVTRMARRALASTNKPESN